MALEEGELRELYAEVMRLMDGNLYGALSAANRTGQLETLLSLLQMSDLLGEDELPGVDPERILVLGESMASMEKLQKVARTNNFDAKLFDFVLEYDRATHYDIRKLRHSTKYKAVMVGPMGHSGEGGNGSSSTIAEMENNPDVYPRVVRLTKNGKLSITTNSFRRGLEELSQLVA